MICIETDDVVWTPGRLLLVAVASRALVFVECMIREQAGVGASAAQDKCVTSKYLAKITKSKYEYHSLSSLDSSRSHQFSIGVTPSLNLRRCPRMVDI